MGERIQISNFQLFSLILLFQIGSTTLFARGIEAKQDAWLAILLALVLGFGLLWVFTEIQCHFPDQNLVEILIATLGKWLAIPLILLYALYFFFVSCFHVYEFADATVQTILNKTPISYVILITIVLVAYIVFSGIEVISRVSEALLPIFLIFLILIYFLVAFSDDIQLDFTQFLPILDQGISPVLQASHSIVNFPFGEMIVFLMYWKYVNDKHKLRKASFWAVGISGIILLVSVTIMIAALGVTLTSISSLPFLTVIRMINVGDFIQRFDALANIIMFIGGFIKMTLFFNASRLALFTLFKIKYEKTLLITMFALWYWFINAYFTSIMYHRWVGIKILVPYVDNFMHIIIPCLILVIIKLKIKQNNLRLKT